MENSSSEEDENVEDRPYCMMCEYLVGQIDSYIADNRTEQSIQQAVESVCDHLRYTLQSWKNCRLIFSMIVSNLVKSLYINMTLYLLKVLQ